VKPAPFDYHAPRTVDEAVALLGDLDNAKVLAGGQSLVPMMNFRYVIVDHIVDLAKIGDLAGISVTNGRMRIGAMTRQRELEFSDEVARHCPLMREALKHVGHRQTRNRGTIGGSLAHADPSAELPTVCAAHDAVIEIASKRGRRQVPFSEFGVAFMTTAAGPDEIIAAIEIPLWPAGHGYGFHEFARRHGDFAIVGAAAMLVTDAKGMVQRASVTLCGVDNTPIRMATAEAALVGRAPDAATVTSAASSASAIKALSDIHASADYRRHLAEVLMTRALRDAAARCKLT
jgi:aerobic carbon-monoxide dehydrogenase medium subunit